MKNAKINKVNIITKSKKSISVMFPVLIYGALIGAAVYLGYIATAFILVGLYAHKRLL